MKMLTTEFCPYCEQETQLKAELSKQHCKNCNKIIKTCSMCETMNCKECVLGE